MTRSEQILTANGEILGWFANDKELSRSIREALTTSIVAASEYAALLDAATEPDYSHFQTVDAIDPAVGAISDNPGWRFIHAGTGKGGQTTLTFRWLSTGGNTDG